jgi:predicted alternative tryptophan synthase beta-subunit
MYVVNEYIWLTAGPDKGKKETRVIAVEPTSCPALTRGIYTYDFGDTVGLTPLLKMYTLGSSFVPPRIHAGGLRYHRDSPLLCLLKKEGITEATSKTTTFPARKSSAPWNHCRILKPRLFPADGAEFSR